MTIDFGKIRMALVVILPIVGLVAAVVLLWNRYVFATDIALLAGLYVVSTLGITVGFHRMLTHNGFKSSGLVRAMFLIFGCWAVEGPPDMWAAVHIKHHAHSDEDDDPHSPLHGFWHAHVGWLFDYYQHVDNYRAFLPKDPVTVFISRTYVVWTALGLLIPFMIGGWTGLLWGGVVRVFFNSHVTWSVNSVCHMFGKREYETTDESRNEWVVGLLAFGEGWHNNHHAFPANAFHGMKWWQFDLSGLTIRMLELLGLVWDVERVHPEVAETQKTRSQAMMHALSDLRASVLTSIASARSELNDLGARLLTQSPAASAQWQHWKSMQADALLRLDSLMQSVTHSAHVKKQRLLQYQREAQKLVQDCKQRLSLVAGDMAVV